jgi:hypothetical protein
MDALATKVQALMTARFIPVPVMGDEDFEQLAFTRMSQPSVVDVVQFRSGNQQQVLATRFGLVARHNLLDPYRPWWVYDRVADTDGVAVIADVLKWPTSLSGKRTE